MDVAFGQWIGLGGLFLSLECAALALCFKVALVQWNGAQISARCVTGSFRYLFLLKLLSRKGREGAKRDFSPLFSTCKICSAGGNEVEHQSPCLKVFLVPVQTVGKDGGRENKKVVGKFSLKNPLLLEQYFDALFFWIKWYLEVLEMCECA